MSILNDDYTLTTIFILPLISNRINTNNIKNCYICNSSNVDDENKIEIIYNDEISDICKIPKKYIQDYDKFLVGYYSKMSDETKSKILDFWSADEIVIDLEGILYKTEKMKEKVKSIFGTDNFSEYAEFFPAPNLLSEIN